MSVTGDKKFRDYVLLIDKLKLDIKRLEGRINQSLNTSSNLVATGSVGSTAGSHSELSGVIGNGQTHLSEDEKAHIDFYNSTFAEQFDFTVTSNGTVITGSLEKTGGGNLTMRFANGEYIILDCDPTPKTVTITAGTDTTPVYRYYYVLQSTPTIITEDTDWSSAEHVKVARLNVPSATFVQTKNVYSNQNIIVFPPPNLKV